MMENGSARNNPAILLFAVIFLIAALLLLALIGSETKFSARGQLFAQPRTWPAIGIGGMVIFAFGLVLTRLRSGLAGAGTESIIWARSLEYLVWFMVYVWLVPIVGYLPVTLIFAPLLAFRLGYRSRQMLLLAAAMGFLIVVVFKAGLSVKIPGGMAYEYLPDAIRNFMIVYL